MKSLVVKAVDKEDGDLTDKVTIVDNGGFNKNVAGTYSITFEVKDSQGATASAKATVTVKDKPSASPETSTTPITTTTEEVEKELPNTGTVASLAVIGFVVLIAATLVLTVKTKKA